MCVINQALGEFNFLLHLKLLIGFSEDWTRIIMHVKQELILLRTSNNINTMVTTYGAANGKLV